MAQIVARNASIYIEGSAGASIAMSGDGNSIGLSFSAEAPEVTTFGDAFRQRLVGGLKDWELSLDAYFNTDSDKVDDVMFSILAGSTLIQFGPNGSGAGAIKYSASAVLSSYDISFGVADAGTVSATFAARSGSMTRSTW